MALRVTGEGWPKVDFKLNGSMSKEKMQLIKRTGKQE